MSVSPAVYSLAQDRADSIDQVRLVAQWATDLPGRILAVYTSLSGGCSVQIDNVDPQDVTDQYGPPQGVRRSDQSDHWRWLHPAGFEVVLCEPLGAA